MKDVKLWMVWDDGMSEDDEAYLAAFYGSYDTKLQTEFVINHELEQFGGPKTLRPVRVTVHLE